MQLEMRLQTGGKQLVEVQDAVFAYPFNEPLVHQVVTAVLAGSRQGSHAQKTRGMVRGGGKKPWRQKGTGRARAGSIRSPIWRKGGVTFAAQPQDYSQKINKKMYQAALRAIYSKLIQEDRLIIINAFEINEPKTRAVTACLKVLKLNQVMILISDPDSVLLQAARNLQKVVIFKPNQVNPVHLVRYEKTLVTLPALRQIEAQLS
jgi:large subunit ribosomal protein L4